MIWTFRDRNDASRAVVDSAGVPDSTSHNSLREAASHAAEVPVQAPATKATTT